MRLLALLFATLVVSGCARSALRTDADPQAVKTAADTFHRRTRWKDFTSASTLIVADRRQAFLDAREAKRDERDLTISDYELLELRLDPNGERAEVVSRITWFRLPSLSENSDTVVSELVREGSTWFIARQSRGPFTPELEEPYFAPEPEPKP